MYMLDSRVLNGKEGIEILELYAIETTVDTEHKKRQITTQEFTHEDSCCSQASCTVKQPGTIFSYDCNGFLVRTASIDWPVQKVVPMSPEPPLLYHLHYPTLARHPGERRMHYSIQREYYWPHMSNEVYTTVRDCQKCTVNIPSEKQEVHYSFSTQAIHCNLSWWTFWEQFRSR